MVATGRGFSWRLISEGVELDPQAWRLLFLLGNLQAAGQEYAAAARSYRRVSDLQPTMAAALANLASVEALQGNVLEARDTYQRALALDPGDAALHYNLGMLLTQLW